VYQELFDRSDAVVYTICVYKIRRGAQIMKTARVFKSGNSQAVRLPREFQLDVKEVAVFKKDGDLVLRPVRRTWKDYFDRGRRFSGDFPDHIEDAPAEDKLPW
jgi:antitoxin VapB